MIFNIYNHLVLLLCALFTYDITNLLYFMTLSICMAQIKKIWAVFIVNISKPLFKQWYLIVGKTDQRSHSSSTEPCHEKTCCFFLKHTSADQLRSNCTTAANQCLCFHYIKCTIPLLPKSKFLCLKASSVAVQPSFCWTGFHMTQFLFL